MGYLFLFVLFCFVFFCFVGQAASSVNIGLSRGHLVNAQNINNTNRDAKIYLSPSMVEVVSCLYVVILNCVSVKLPVKFQSKR